VLLLIASVIPLFNQQKGSSFPRAPAKKKSPSSIQLGDLPFHPTMLSRQPFSTKAVDTFSGRSSDSRIILLALLNPAEQGRPLAASTRLTTPSRCRSRNFDVGKNRLAISCLLAAQWLTCGFRPRSQRRVRSRISRDSLFKLFWAPDANHCSNSALVCQFGF